MLHRKHLIFLIFTIPVRCVLAQEGNAIVPPMHVQLSNQHLLNEEKWKTGNVHVPLKLSYTLDLYNLNHFQTIKIVEGNAKLIWRGWQFRARRYRDVIGEIDSSLCSGSLRIGGNALPMPKLSIKVSECKNIPGTHG